MGSSVWVKYFLCAVHFSTCTRTYESVISLTWFSVSRKRFDNTSITMATKSDEDSFSVDSDDSSVSKESLDGKPNSGSDSDSSSVSGDSMPPVVKNSYELSRELRIARNNQRLLSLGLLSFGSSPVKRSPSSTKAARKKKELLHILVLLNRSVVHQDFQIKKLLFILLILLYVGPAGQLHV